MFNVDNSLIVTVVHWIISASALMVTAFFVPGFEVKNFPTALIAAVVIGTANIFIRPLLLFLTLPLNILTLGLFTFVVNAIVLKMCAALMRNFNIRSWTSAVLGAVILAFVGTFLHIILV